MQVKHCLQIINNYVKLLLLLQIFYLVCVTTCIIQHIVQNSLICMDQCNKNGQFFSMLKSNNFIRIVTKTFLCFFFLVKISW
jgi:hypothetical protein